MIELIPVDRPTDPERVRHHLSASLARSGCEDWSVDQMLYQAWAGRWKLFEARDGDKVVGAGVVGIQDFGKRRILEVIAFGADAHTKPWLDTLNSLKAFAKSLDCHAIRCEGRPGWKRVLKAKQINLFEIEV